MPDIKKFEDTFTEVGSGEPNLTTHKFDIPANHSWQKELSGNILVNETDDIAKFERNSNNEALYHASWTSILKKNNYVQAKVRASYTGNHNSRVGIIGRYDVNAPNDRGLIVCLRGSVSGGNRIHIMLFSSGSTSSLTNFFINWNEDTWYTLRAEFRNKASDVIEIKVYLDGNLEGTYEHTDATLHDVDGVPGLYAKSSGNASASDEWQWDDLEAGDLVDEIDVTSSEHLHFGEMAGVTIDPASAEHLHTGEKAKVLDVPVDSSEHLHTAEKAGVTIDPASAEHLHTGQKATVESKVDSSEHLHTGSMSMPITIVTSAEHLHTGQKATVESKVDSSEHLHFVFSAARVTSSEHLHTAEKAGVTIDPASAEHLHTGQKATVESKVDSSEHLHFGEMAGVAIINVASAEHLHFGTKADITGILRWATQYCKSDIQKNYPIILVELAERGGALDPDNPHPGPYFDKIAEIPEVSDQTTTNTLGIRTRADVELLVRNKDRFFKVDNTEEDIQDWTVAVWRRVNGVNEKLFLGKVSSLKISPVTRVVLKDAVRAAFQEKIPHRFITTDTFPEAKDTGDPIGIFFGLNERILCPNIEWDDQNRQYRYSLGEGKGYNDEYYKEVLFAYKEDQLFRAVTGTVVDGGSDWVELEAPDYRPADWFKWEWVHINDDTPKYVTTSDASGRLEINGTFDNNPQSGDTYIVRPWRFRDGSQSVFNGIAHLQFKKPIINGSTILKVYATVNALQQEKNYVRAVQSLISNPIWG